MRRLFVLGVAVLLVACERPQTPAPRAEASFEQLRAEGDARLAQREYEAAVRAYRAALAYEPRSLPVRYSLGVALAHLNRIEEAVTAFAWVVEHGPPTGEEVRLARRWLVEAAARASAVVESATTGRPDSAEAGSYGLLQGKTEWTDLDPNRARPHVQILLEGNDFGIRGRRYWVKAPLNEPYEIARVIPGRYRVIAQVGPTRLWDTTVTVQADRPTILDLTQAMSIAPRDALRPAAF